MSMSALARLAAITTAALLAGCATPIARSVVQANLAQEQAANQLLLLNIARAHQRMPMHFSQIGQIRATTGGWGLGVPTLGLEIPFGGAAERKYTLSASNEGQTPADVTPLASQEFVRGITTPVAPTTLAFFINQGWPSPLLMHLFFESVQDGDNTLRNDPGSKGYGKFREFVDSASACNLVLMDGSTTFLTEAMPALSVHEVVRARAAKLAIVAVRDDGVQDKDPAKNKHVRLADPDKEALLELRKPAADAPHAVQCKQDQATLRLTARARIRPDQGARQAGSVDQQPRAVEREVVLRSPQAALYYLGQLSRAQEAGWYGPEHQAAENKGQPLLMIPLADGTEAPMFHMSSGDDLPRHAVAVQYADRTFAVPPDDHPPTKWRARSMTVLSLMQLILGLQDKGSEAPAASSVRLVR